MMSLVGGAIALGGVVVVNVLGKTAWPSGYNDSNSQKRGLISQQDKNSKN